MRKAVLCNRLGGSALAFILAAGLAGAVHAQDDLPPLYQVEVIVFAYDDYDPSEELFQGAPTAANGRGTEVPQRREPFRYEEPDLEALLSPRGRVDDELGAVTGPSESDFEPGVPDTGGADVPGAFETGANGVPETDGPLPIVLDPLVPEEPQPFGIRRLSADELQLGAALGTLDRLGAYTPLVHVGWVQEGLPESQAVPFDLSQLGRFTPTGTIQLHISQFQRLRLHVDLEYRASSGASRSPGLVSRFELTDVTAPPRFVLREDRVTRTGELHYFDHPAFGMLAVVRQQAREMPEDAAVPTPVP